MVERLRPPTESESSDTAHLVAATAAIKDDLERGETPEKKDVESARFALGRVERRLDEVTALFNWNPWDTGVTWGELTAAQKVDVYERERVRTDFPLTEE
ncbi:hypothetical protein C485_03268 [Natrinema altunense JCM 12890]|uniref:Uncharacterized protein n=1 Tax=Natrinema altunense (strain JCM 12890 / CGMCC 1.3731 / AJ2) TaxID=1227494 RepID=L9ZUA6_NATA2|nr:hypothetical protein C485_03268 [Natrinema altunense JCM 12890]